MWLKHYNENHDPKNGQFTESATGVRKRVTGTAKDFDKYLSQLDKRNEKLANRKAQLSVEYRRAKKRKDKSAADRLKEEMEKTRQEISEGSLLVRQLISDANYAGLSVNSTRVQRTASLGKLTASDMYKGALPKYIQRDATFWSSKYHVSGTSNKTGDAYVEDTAPRQKYSSVSKKTRHYNLHQLSVRVKDLEWRKDQAVKVGDEKRAQILDKEIEAAYKRLHKGK